MWPGLPGRRGGSLIIQLGKTGSGFQGAGPLEESEEPLTSPGLRPTSGGGYYDLLLGSAVRSTPAADTTTSRWALPCVRLRRGATRPVILAAAGTSFAAYCTPGLLGA